MPQDSPVDRAVSAGPAFILGVVGPLTLAPETERSLEQTVRRVFAWLRASNSESVEELGPGLGLQVTPLRLVTALEPGAAQRITQLASESGHHVLPAVPVPMPLSLQAAREFVATSCDVLLAISEAGPPGSSTTDEQSNIAQVIEIKRRGVAEQFSDESTGLSWTNNGAVIHVVLPSATADAAKTSPVAGSIQILHPYDCRPTDQPKCPDDDPNWQWQGNRIVREIVANLERLNAEPSRTSPKKEQEALANMIGAEALHELPLDFQNQLDAFAKLRRRVADQNNHYDDQVKKLTQAFFLLAAVTVIASQIYQNGVSPQAMAPATKWMLCGVELANFAWVRTGFFCLGLLSTALAWWVFHRSQSRWVDDRQNDYRALAEGLRVQFYWSACGLGRSVAAHYLQRQRGELSWIRRAIRAGDFPSESWRERFQNLSLSAQKALLRGLHGAWIKQQENFFRERVAEFSARKDSFQRIGHSCLWAGLVLVLELFAVNTLDLEQSLQHRTSEYLELGICISLLLFSVWLSDRPWRKQPHRLPKRHVWQVLYPRWKYVLSLLTLSRAETWKPRLEFLTALLVGVALAMLAAGVVYRWGPMVSFLPEPAKALTITKNLALSVGGFFVLWTRVKFLPENIRRYDAMASLYRAADLRLSDELARLESQLHNQDHDGAMLTIQNVQSLVFELGQEALSENAEWLVMHRDRRIKPLVAGS